jgi:hypothetical protein
MHHVTTHKHFNKKMIQRAWNPKNLNVVYSHDEVNYNYINQTKNPDNMKIK